MSISLRILCIVTAVLCNIQRSLEHEIPRRSFLSRRAIDGTRGRKYFDPNEEGAFDSYGSADGHDPYDHVTDLSDIRKNVPGEPGIDYPAYTTLPQTGFTCEGRSRGYYADETAGCQVFHVCHDVLVSSFLCPIGSTFSQKLLTCDWWTKVDCASSSRYLEVNRKNYQIDDDEMIRNAYAMINLQSTEDVTKDGLVDPDSGSRIIDYSALGGRTVSYAPGFRRITDYPSVDPTENDLLNGFDDYSHDPRILHYDRYQQKTKVNSAYQGKFHPENQERSPYHAAPIIRHDHYQDHSSDNEFQHDYRRLDQFTNRLQTSYAPTVPTVTTTTRKMYSPTVPTYRSSTLAYNKLDLLMDSSDHLYAHSKSLGSLSTPPTIIPQNDDSRNVDLRASETRYDDLKKFENISSSRTDSVPLRDDKVHLNFEKSNVSFRINVTDVIDEDEIFRQQNDKPVIRNDSEESSEDIETEDSIGIVRALSSSLGKIVVQSQDPVGRVLKDDPRDATALSPLLINVNRSSESDSKRDITNSTQTLNKSGFFVVNEMSSDKLTEDYDDIEEKDINEEKSTTKNFERIIYMRSFGDRTTPLQDKNWQQKEDSSAQTSTTSITIRPTTNITGKSINKVYNVTTDHFPSNDNRTEKDQNSSPTKSVSRFSDKSVSEIKITNFEILRPSQFLKPPSESFLINVPQDTHYTISENLKTSWNPKMTTTEISQFSSTPAGSDQDVSPVYNEDIQEQSLIDYEDEDLPETLNSGDHPTDRVLVQMSTPIPWLVSSWHDHSIVSVPVTDIVPPLVDYNDSFDDFPSPEKDTNEHSAEFDHTERVRLPETQNSPTISDDEAKILSQYNSGLQFTIRDAVKAQLELKVDSKSPCYRSNTSNEQVKPCENSSLASKVVVSTPSVREKTTLVSTKATTKIPERLISSSNTLFEKPVKIISNQTVISTTQFPITIRNSIVTEKSTLKMITTKDLQTKEPEEKLEQIVDSATTASSLIPNSVRPGSLIQIAETIDRQNSPYEVSVTVKKDENLETTADDFISRLIARHQQSTSDLKEQPGDFEIIKSVEPEDEIATTSKIPEIFDISHASPTGTNSNFPVALNDTVSQSKKPDSNLNMLNLVQLMAELLRLDRLPRPFSAKDLSNVELVSSLNLDFDERPVTTNPLLDHLQARTPLRNVNFKPSLNTVTPQTLLNLGQNEPSFITTNLPLDHSQARTPIRNVNFKVSTLDTLRTPSNIATPKTLLNLSQNEPSFITTNPPLDYLQDETTFRNTNFKAPTFDMLKTPANTAAPAISLNLEQNEPSFVTANPLLDHLRVRTPFRNTEFKVSSFDDSKMLSNVAFKSFLDVSSKPNFDHVTESKTSQMKSESETIRPPHKQEILEQLTENFGQPLYRGDLVPERLIFDLPQVQRSLDFETGLPIKENKRIISKIEEANSISSTTISPVSPTTQKTTTESVKTIVETEFVPSISFSFDTNEGREEYVEAVLGGLIDDHTRNRRNESNNTQLIKESPKNETLKSEENSKDT